MDFSDRENADDKNMLRYGVWIEAVTCVLASGVYPRLLIGDSQHGIEPKTTTQHAAVALQIADTILGEFDRRFPEVKEATN